MRSSVSSFTTLIGKKRIKVALAAKGLPKAELARLLNLDRRSLYHKPKMPARDLALYTKIIPVMIANPGYGHRPIADQLTVGKDRVLRVMQKFSLKPARRAKAPRKLQDRGREKQPYADITARLSPVVPNHVWASDFTYCPYRGRFVYLATVLDLFTGEPLGCNISLFHDAALVRKAIERAIVDRGTLPNYFHSDQGSEYVSETVNQWLQEQGVTISMAPKASPWRNASQESFYGRFKIAFGDFDRFDSLGELIEALYGHIHYFRYDRIKNRLRMPPARFYSSWLQRENQITNRHARELHKPATQGPATQPNL